VERVSSDDLKKGGAGRTYVLSTIPKYLPTLSPVPKALDAQVRAGGCGAQKKIRKLKTSAKKRPYLSPDLEGDLLEYMLTLY
jgi:hypothetical protein